MNQTFREVMSPLNRPFHGLGGVVTISVSQGSPAMRDHPALRLRRPYRGCRQPVKPAIAFRAYPALRTLEISGIGRTKRT